MPIYEFVCLSCGNDFEKVQSFSDTSSPLCPACHSDQVKRRLSPPAIHFKGSGWYVTDSKGAKNGKAASESTSKGGEKSGDSSSKPASGESATTGESGQKSESASDTPAKTKAASSAAKDSA
ncbi:MAG TPA: zinc ribbon domain-containing protein [Caldilineaceae bacterium]|nr:zinc ribbon domain-containing protein [Caldilineaceae bacterium]